MVRFFVEFSPSKQTKRHQVLKQEIELMFSKKFAFDFRVEIKNFQVTFHVVENYKFNYFFIKNKKKKKLLILRDKKVDIIKPF